MVFFEAKLRCVKTRHCAGRDASQRCFATRRSDASKHHSVASKHRSVDARSYAAMLHEAKQ